MLRVGRIQEEEALQHRQFRSVGDGAGRLALRRAAVLAAQTPLVEGGRGILEENTRAGVW